LDTSFNRYFGEPSPFPSPFSRERVYEKNGFPLLFEERIKVRSSFDKYKIKG
jgi:hypothetical protein